MTTRALTALQPRLQLQSLRRQNEAQLLLLLLLLLPGLCGFVGHRRHRH
jgi:hypothetical protein